ncbi:MAG: hypothetical protein COV08_00560 [Candidatus Vogelbacteria bacterium CG10_big_fil_rev_8_21_14_0_10_49_38]|uniref:Uncharacterized protein n=1 Tax=Candidatus Vogelbacteria bacterium CG10_big_fil_rev_8_21_14_0_10_49_38 TaxID=1975043 RepID=A0A2H0RIZ6_9BACT|nr:MAG: hypothetical protein BK006_00565 [bacterium CG10_49_38]PIR46410.1 MAG: hypothetical protein COV08_00560 [Candidatus Vogelbacteria bacterium CG10_big_fil_rev_8_21_14_0_10_49_38]
MFEAYVASGDDLKAIENALEFVFKEETDFIFKDRKKILDVTIISYDSKYLYLWSRDNSRYQLNKLPHDLEIKDFYHQGWTARLQPSGLGEFLPEQYQGDRFNKPKISGGLLTPFLALQKKKKKSHNPYVSYESYLATIIHEFSHVYYDSYRPWWYSDREDNLKIMRSAKRLYLGGLLEEKLPLWFPTPDYVSELFAFCGEYALAAEFWPEHKKTLDQYYGEMITELIKQEQEKI